MVRSFASTVSEIMVRTTDERRDGDRVTEQSTQGNETEGGETNAAGSGGLADLLELEVLDRDLFRGENDPGAGERLSLYGGQVAAQALRAAGLTVPDDRLPHSLHGYFLRPGRVDRPVLLHVDRDRDGG